MAAWFGEITPPGEGAIDDKYIHESDSCVYILEGTYEIEFNGSKVLLEEGDSIFFPKGISYKYLNIGKKVAKAFVVNVPPSF